MRHTVLFYVSGHGLGHAVRSAEIVRALAARGDVDAIYIRTSAAWPPLTPPKLGGKGGPTTPVHVSPTAIDAGAVERNPLAIDAERTLARAAEVLACREERVAAEAEFARRAGATVIAADAPFLAGEVAAAAGVPCFAVTNFTWDWIYEPLAAACPRHAGVLEPIRDAYRKMAGWIRLPFHHDSDLFPRVIDAPLVARHPAHCPDQVLATLGLDPDDHRPRVLIAMRGGIPEGVLRRAAAGCPGFLFLDLAESPRPPEGNLRRVAIPAGLTFTDVLSICGFAVSKLGYGVVSECVAAGVGLLWVRRSGFREDALIPRQAERCTRLHEIPIDDYHAGDWAGHLERLRAMPAPAERMETNGALVCAELLAGGTS